MLVTPHFHIEEFRCRDGAPYPSTWLDARLRPLCAALESIREACGGHSLVILSGYRTPAHNESLRTKDGSGSGVAKDSQHVHGRAADITIEGMAPADVHAVILSLDGAGKIKIGGLGRYAGWCHVDVRQRPPDGHLARWTG